MNAHNHHKVIQNVSVKVAQELKNNPSCKAKALNWADIKMLNRASDYTDHFPGLNSDTGAKGLAKTTVQYLAKDEEPFFYYHFYYDIQLYHDEQVKEGVIKLTRSNMGESTIDNTFKNCDFGSEQDNFYQIKTYNYSYITIPLYKKFFTTIHGRDKFLKPHDKADLSNQSDCVAFLHAMGAEAKTRGVSYSESERKSEKVFSQHLKDCFSEYLFLNDNREALFILGIALHSVMDSFTPSHMGFQHYAAQNMALHAQGDVVPFEGDMVFFEPGQYTLDNVASCGKTWIADQFSKGFNNNDHLNDVEFNMLEIFVKIGGILENDQEASMDEKEKIRDRVRELLSKEQFGVSYTPGCVNVIKGERSLPIVNDTIKGLSFSKKSCLYSKAAIDVCTCIYIILSEVRSEIHCYSDYLEKKNDAVKRAFLCWETKYRELEDVRAFHLNLNLYDKAVKKVYSKTQSAFL